MSRRDQTDARGGKPRARSVSMHEGVPIWDDEPCCCEPEPRWQAVREELQEQEQEQRRRAEERAGERARAGSDPK